MKTFSFIVKVFVAVLVGFAAMCVAIAYDASDEVAIGIYFGVAIAITALLGAFGMPAKREQSKFNTVKHKGGMYKHAA